MTSQAVIPHSIFSDFDISLFKSGKHFKLYEKMGNTQVIRDGRFGTYFAVWAPNALEVSVMGSFNQWDRQSHKLNVRWDGSGIWEGFIPDVEVGTIYKYAIKMRKGGYIEKGDPYAEQWQIPPETASIVSEFKYKWSDKKWMSGRKDKNSLNAPISVYEVHTGSWKRKGADGN